MGSREFVLVNIPESFWEYGDEIIINYVEGNLKIDVKEVKLCHNLPDRAVIILENEITDFNEIARTVSETSPGSWTLQALEANKLPAIVVEGLDVNKLPEDFACLYFESEFAKGRAVIHSSQSWPDHNLTVFKFQPSNMSVVRKILKQTTHVALPSENYQISVGPFYCNFHDVLEQILSTRTKLNLEETCHSIMDFSSNCGELVEEETNSHSDTEFRGEADMPDKKESPDINEETRRAMKSSGEKRGGNNIEIVPFSSEVVKSGIRVSQSSYGNEEDDMNEGSEEEGKSDISLSEEEEEEEVNEKVKLMSADVQTDRRKTSVPLISGGHRMFPERDKKMLHERKEKGRQFHKSRGRSKNNKNLGKANRSSNYKEGFSEIPSRSGRERYRSQESGTKFDRAPAEYQFGSTFKSDEAMTRENHTDLDLFDTNNLNLSSSKHTKPSTSFSKPRGGGQYGAPHGTSRTRQVHMPSNLDNRPLSGENGQHSNFSVERPMSHDHHMIKLDAEQLQFQKSVERLKDVDLSARDERDKTFELLQEDLKKYKEENTRLLETHKDTSEEIRMTTWQYDLLSEFFGSFGDCHVYYNPLKETAFLEGRKHEIEQRQNDLRRALSSWKHDEIQLNLGVQFDISSERGKAILNTSLNSELKKVKLFQIENSLIIAAKEDDILDTATDILRKELNHKDTRMSKSTVPQDKLKYLKSQLQSGLGVNLSWNNDATSICVEGIRNDVLNAMKEVDKFLDEYQEHEGEFSVSGPQAIYINKYLEGKMTFPSDVTVTDIVTTDQRISVKLKGKRIHINQILRNLESLKLEVVFKQWDIKSEWTNNEDLWLLTRCLQSDTLKINIKLFEFENKCCVIPTLPKLESFKMKYEEIKKSIRKPAKSSQSRTPKKQRAHATGKTVSNDLNFNLTSTCKMVVKPYGNIISDTSDILVCVLTSSVDLRKTKVGIAFNRACPHLWKALNAEKEAHPEDPVLTTNGPFTRLKCQAICHVILSPWDANTSPAKLEYAIRLVLKQAVLLGAKSVSFPPLGCGITLRFPSTNVAQIVIATIKSENLGQNLNRITLLAPDVELFTELKIEASKNLSALIPQPQGATSGPDQVSDEDDIFSSEESEESEDDGQVEVALQDTSSWSICIVAARGSGLDKLWSQLKHEIEKQCLATDYFNQQIVDICPKKTFQSIIAKAKESFVWVQKSPNPKTKKLGFFLKGEPNSVKEVKHLIKQEINEISRHVPRKRIYGTDTPKRGTVPFLKHASDSDEPFPSYWKLNESKGFWKELFQKKPKNKFLVTVDKETEAAIKKLVEQTTIPAMVGAGKDGVGLSYKKIKVVNVKRVENPNLFEAYQTQRKRLFVRMSGEGKICQDIGQLPHSKGRIVTTKELDDSMKKELYYEVNEHYLFHGTNKDTIDAIIMNGFDPRVSSATAMFGKGIYAAEMFTKSDQYTDNKTQRTPPGTELTMILARVLLGNVYLCNERHPSVASQGGEKLTRPPCVHCHKDKCNCPNQDLFDSVMGDGKWNFREFVVYDKHNCYPEYIITYKRC